MMWVFEPQIAAHRKTYQIPVRIKALEGLASAGRRTGKIVATQAPKTFPLDENKRAEVEIEYTDNRSRMKCSVVPVRDLDIMNPKNGCELVVIGGGKKGTIVRHVKTIQDKVKARERERRRSTTYIFENKCFAVRELEYSGPPLARGRSNLLFRKKKIDK